MQNAELRGDLCKPIRSRMNSQTKIQLAMALAGIPVLLFVWKPDAKWPNPFALDTSGQAARLGHSKDQPKP
tara:strand:+ start:259 stop:471 length:213 start_codon:yes stop_codon:yes gene_type:complete